jgi:hypothetical protein
MEKEVTLENNLLPPNKRYTCVDCLKSYTSIEHCKDGKERCYRCKRKMVTNKFYDPNWKIRNQRVSKWSISNQEKSLLITTKMQQGKSYEQAKNKVNYCEKVLSTNKSRKYFEEKTNEMNLIKQKESNKEMNKRLIEGLNEH